MVGDAEGCREQAIIDIIDWAQVSCSLANWIARDDL